MSSESKSSPSGANPSLGRLAEGLTLKLARQRKAAQKAIAFLETLPPEHQSTRVTEALTILRDALDETTVGRRRS